MRAFHPLTGLAGLALAAVAPAGAETTLIEPGPLFVSVCTQGGAHLPAKDVHEARYRDLPPSARTALRFGINAKWVSDYMEPLGRRGVSNSILAIGHDRDYFLVSPSDGKSGAPAGTCAVIWRGRHFSDARDVVRKFVGEKGGSPDADANTSPIDGVHMFAFRGPDYRMVANETDGWTVLRMTPVATPPTGLPGPFPATHQ